MTDVSRRTTMGAGLAAGAMSFAPRRGRAQTPTEVKDRHAGAAVRSVGAPGHPGADGWRGWQLTTSTVPVASSRWAAQAKLVEYDTQDSAEKAKDGAQRMIAQEADLVGGFGCWLSSFTLAATEVTERAGCRG